jgi:hypothetical protein
VADDLPGLLRRLRGPDEEPAELDWLRVEGESGLTPPEAYKTLADHLGPGVVAGELALAHPGHPDPRLDLQTFARFWRDVLRSDGAERTDLVAWAEVEDHVLCWDPQDWTVVVDLDGEHELLETGADTVAFLHRALDGEWDELRLDEAIPFRPAED